MKLLNYQIIKNLVDKFENSDCNYLEGNPQ